MKTFTLAFAGDTSLGYAYIARRPEHEDRLRNDPMSYFQDVLPIVKGADQFILNLETVLSTTPGTPIEGKQWPGLDDPETTLRVLKELGVTAVSMANNHAMDFGSAKLLETIDHLRKAGIEVFGAGGNIVEASRPYRFTLKGDRGSRNVYVIAQMRPSRRYIEYGFFASKTTPGINSTRIQRIQRQITRIRRNDPDALIIACPHWQGFDYQPVKEKLKEHSRQLVDLSADLVLAHGTHRADEVEIYKGVTIAHSIGNFVFNSPGRYASKKCPPVSFISIVKAFESEDGWQLEPDFIPINTNNRENGFKSRPLTLPELEALPTPLKNILPLHRASEPAQAPHNASGTSGLSSPATSAKSTLPRKFSINSSLLSATEGFRDIANTKGEMFAVGADYRLKIAKKGFLLFVTDHDWPRRRQEQSGQKGLTNSEIAAQAETQQAAGIILKDTRENRKLRTTLPLIFVENTYDYLPELATVVRSNYKGRIVAVTGSSGKSTTVEMLHSAIIRSGSTAVRTVGNSNRLLDVRSYISRLKERTSFYVLEMAASALGNSSNVSLLAKPHVAILTSIAPGHLDDLGDLESVAARKSNVFKGLVDNGLALICRDIPFYETAHASALTRTQNILSYGVHRDSDIRLLEYSETTGDVEADFQGSMVSYNMGKLGSHMVLNSLATLATLKELGLDWAEAAREIGSFVPVKGRGQVLQLDLDGRLVTVIDESYNANPLSMRTALGVLRIHSPPSNGRRIAVLGDMLELGPDAPDYHTELLDAVVASKAEKVYLVGEAIHSLWQLLPASLRGGYASTADGIEAMLADDLRPGDHLLFKASNATGLHEIVASWKSASRLKEG